MRRNSLKVLKQLLFNSLLTVLVLIPVVSHAINEGCGKHDAYVHNTSKDVVYKELPYGLRKVMSKMNCDVKTGSSYDEGYSLDLNSDGKHEYAFCCTEAPHGPCGMMIFGNVSGKWKVLYDHIYGYSVGKLPFEVLQNKHSGYNDICIDVGGREDLVFKNGSYHLLQGGSRP